MPYPPRRTIQRTFTPQQLQEFGRAYVSGEATLPDLARVNGTTWTILRDLLAAEGFGKRPKAFPRPAFTAEEVSELARQYTEDGIAILDLARQRGTTQEYIREVLTKQAGVTIRIPGRPPRNIHVGVVILRYRKGDSIEAIAARYHVAQKRIREILNEAGER